MFKPRRIVIALTAIILALVFGIEMHRQPAVASGGECNPTSTNRPVCPSTATAESASFLDPMAAISSARKITLGEKVYVAPFAVLNANDGPIRIAEESNVQDRVRIIASGTGVEIGPRVILAHRAVVKGAAKIATQGSSGPFTDPTTGVQFSNDPPETFIQFGCEVDGAIIEKNTIVESLARVGPGVTLPSGKVVLAGKNVTTNAEASDGSLGKVVNLAQANFELMQAIIEVNEALAKGYTELARKDSTNVTGANYDPNTSFNPGEDLPSANGQVGRIPDIGQRRIIGDVRLKNTREEIVDLAENNDIGQRISLRADEGKPFKVGKIGAMASDVVFHALEFASLEFGDGIGYGRGALVHGGKQVINGIANGSETKIGNNVGLAANSVVFRSVIGDGSAIGVKSAVLNSTLPPGTMLDNRLIYANDGAFISVVEW